VLGISLIDSRLDGYDAGAVRREPLP
jgi:hypothetical protein